jgi:HAD superfamily hydrolase (TIGR01450 family)
MRFGKFETFIFDLDGTLWKWNRLVPGAKELVAELKRNGKQVLFITNGTILSQLGLVKKLWRFDVDAKYDEVITPAISAANFFKRRMRKGERVLVMGRGLKEDLEARGVKTTCKVTADYALVSHDLKFDYMKLLTAVSALNRGAKLYTTARGRYFVVGNDMWPGTGVIATAVEYASGKKAELLGKPSEHMLKVIRAVNKSKPSKTVLIGDEINSDIKSGKELGYHTVLVRTGVDSKRKINGRVRPDTVLKSVADIRL